MRDEKKRAYAESLKKDMERGSVVSNPKSSHTENVTASISHILKTAIKVFRRMTMV